MAVFTGVREHWRPLYEQLRNMALEQLGDFEESEGSSVIMWKNNTTFADVKAKKACMVVGVLSNELHEAWGAESTFQASKNRFAHYFDVVDDSRFPALLEYMESAYAITGATKRKKQPDMPEFETVDEYIAMFPDDIQQVLKKVRAIVKENAPEAEERTSWKMPSYYMGEPLIHFSAAQKHLGVYPTPNGVEAFADRLSEYKTTKGGVQFPFNKPLPYDLIADMVKYRVSQIKSK